MKSDSARRKEDMSPDGFLQITQESDGDIIVRVVGVDYVDRITDSQIQFCECAFGGGRSPKTRKALLALMKAMDEENAEKPI